MLDFLKLIYWRVKFRLHGFKYYPIGGAGDDDDEPTPPPAPSPRETTREAISAQVESLPDILQAQQEFGPQFTQLQLEQLQQFGPEFAQAALELQQEFGPQIGAALRAEQEAAAPELGAARETLTSFLQQPQELSAQERRQAQQDIRGAQQARGLVETGFGAEQELEGLTRLRQELKTRRLNIALATAGRAPVTGATQQQQQQFGPGQLVQNVQPGQIFGLAASTFGTQGSIFNTQAQLAAAQQGPGLGGILGGIGGAAIGGLAGGFGTAAGGAFASNLFGGGQ